MKFNTSFEERFWKKVNKTETCWLWCASTSNGKYGQISYNSKGSMMKAHRASYILAYGNFDKNLLVCHKCDTPLCVNPEHLFLGTHSDNIADRDKKSRQARRSKHGKSKLTEIQVKEIRAKYIPIKYSTLRLAKEYKVSQTSIYNIIINKHWKP